MLVKKLIADLGMKVFLRYYERKLAARGGTRDIARERMSARCEDPGWAGYTDEIFDEAVSLGTRKLDTLLISVKR